MSSIKRLLPLDGIKVIEIAGLAPAPFAGMVLADFGANVIRVDKSTNMHNNMDKLTRHKRSISINLKSPIGISILKRLIYLDTDILIEPFRPGRFSNMAGHDINYLAVSGVLSLLGRKDDPDFAGGGMMCVLGILFALIERSKSGKGQIIDVAMVDGVKYLATFLHLMKLMKQLMTEPRGENMLDGGAHFYEVYETKDNKYMAVGAIEPQFYAELLKRLGLNENSLPSQLDNSKWNEMKQLFKEKFMTKTQDEWNQVFFGSDACVTPVYELSGKVPEPAPKLYETPGRLAHINESLDPGKHSEEILKESGYSESEIKEFSMRGIVGGLNFKKSLL
ncbi:6312_t:CDS:2 [Funneliformis caledonium]|uniref:6312_t:CDS:1 n=1 Tax=Funneliformis caledonium TaxID=1117310 RepID=A0A9N8YMZ0_9GLOM|nr:6312_t:CDS:2 [Funneliformis caledonium]